MQTVMIFDQCGQEQVKFAVLEGDYTHLNGIYINSTENEEEKERELMKLLYEKDGTMLVKLLDFFPVEAVINGGKVIVTGFLS
jgi:hypothetical protein